MINQCWTNGTVPLQCGAIKIRYNISHIKSYTSDTNVEDINPEKYLRLCQHMNDQLYNSVLYIKACNKLYNQMHTETFDMDAYRLFKMKFFMTK